MATFCAVSRTAEMRLRACAASTPSAGMLPWVECPFSEERAIWSQQRFSEAQKPWQDLLCAEGTRPLEGSSPSAESRYAGNRAPGASADQSENRKGGRGNVALRHGTRQVSRRPFGRRRPSCTRAQVRAGARTGAASLAWKGSTPHRGAPQALRHPLRAWSPSPSPPPHPAARRCSPARPGCASRQ